MVFNVCSGDKNTVEGTIIKGKSYVLVSVVSALEVNVSLEFAICKGVGGAACSEGDGIGAPGVLKGYVVKSGSLYGRNGSGGAVNGRVLTFT